MSDEITIADPEMGDAEIDSVVDVLESGQLTDGPEVRSFEQAFAAFCDAEYGIATANGTTALHAALEAVGVDDGDRVLTTPFSFVATGNAIRFAGATPVFGDVDPETYNLTPASAEARLRDGDVDAILAVHLFGLPADVESLSRLADEYDVPLVEDAAQAHGAAVDDRRVGSLGDAAAFSFYPTKNMTTAEGGMVTTTDEEIADAAARFVNHGRADAGHGYEHVELGHNYRMTDIAAAIGHAQLNRLPDYNERRRANAARYDDLLADSALITPTVPDGYRHVYHQYTVRCGNRDAVKEALAERGIGSGVYYPTPIHRQPAFEAFEAVAPVAETVADQVLSLPVHPGVDADDVSRVARALTDEIEVEHV